MGNELLIGGPNHAPWAVVLERLATRGVPATVKMIDGLPAFPGEVPDESCSELRLSFPAGMVSLKRVAAGVVCVVWGNAGAELIAARDACAAACAG